MELRKVRGPVLDTFYARLRRCGNLACADRPFTEHRAFPGVVIEPGKRSGLGLSDVYRGCTGNPLGVAVRAAVNRRRQIV